MIPRNHTVWLAASIGVLLAPGSARAAEASFVRFTDWAGVGVQHLSYGYDHDEYTGGGAVGDFNNDGYQDFFAVSGGRLSVHPRDYLFINNGNGTFTELSQEWGLTGVHLGKGAAVGDINNDGWLDLFVVSAGPVGAPGPGHHRLYRNNGDDTFTEIAEDAGVNQTALIEDGFGATFGDYDLDGDLDLFVAGFAGGAGNRLFRNDGEESFTDVTDDIGLFDHTPVVVRGFAPRFVDMDGDRYPELLIGADFGTSRYFRNDGDGTFTDITTSTGTGTDENGMGQCVGDFNGDGRLDWYITSIYLPQDGWTGNKLYSATGTHTYVEEAEARGVDDGGYGWAALAVDFNHDGRLDIAETNGDAGAVGSPFRNEQSYLWIQNDEGDFDELALASGLAHIGRGRGMANFDFDNDGRQDVLIFSYGESLNLYRNIVTGDDAHWLRVFLDTSGEGDLAPNGHGARVTATANGVSQIRVIASGDHFLSHSELSAHFGLGPATMLESLRVDWPDGRTTELQNVYANRTLRLNVAGEIPACSDGYDNDKDEFVDVGVDPGCTSANDLSEVKGDLDFDNDVDAVDKDLFLACFGSSQGQPAFVDHADFDRDGIVTFVDYQTWLESYRFQTSIQVPGSCGLLGIEPVIVLGLVQLFRRRTRR